MQKTCSWWLIWQKLGYWKRHSQLEARPVCSDSYFLPCIFRRAAFSWLRLEGLGVLEEPGIQILLLLSLLSCKAALWLRALTAPTHRGRNLLKKNICITRHYSLVCAKALACPAPAALVKLNLQSHPNSTRPLSFLLSRAESPWQQCLQTAGEAHGSSYSNTSDAAAIKN